MGEGTRFKAGMPLESMNGLTQRAKKGAALLERGTLGGRFNGIRLMRALLFVLSEQQDCRPGAGYDEMCIRDRTCWTEAKPASGTSSPLPLGTRRDKRLSAVLR